MLKIKTEIVRLKQYEFSQTQILINQYTNTSRPSHHIWWAREYVQGTFIKRHNYAISKTKQAIALMSNRPILVDLTNLVFINFIKRFYLFI